MFLGLLKLLLLPPMLLLTLAIFAPACPRQWRSHYLGTLFTLFAALSTPVVANGLLWAVEQESPPLLESDFGMAVTDFQPQAIVVLAGGKSTIAPHWKDSAVPNTISQERLAHGVRLVRLTGLPLLLSGGNADANAPAEAVVMAEALSLYGLQARWVEDQSRNTQENARYSAQKLRPDGVSRILLVTHAFHIPRAQRAFENAGFSVLPAPARYWGAPYSFEKAVVSDFLPSPRAVYETWIAFYETVGRWVQR